MSHVLTDHIFFRLLDKYFFLLYASKISKMFTLLKLLACNGSSRVGLVILGMLRRTMLASLWFCCTSSILICFCKWWKSIGTLRVMEGRTSDGMDWVREIWDPGDIYLTYYVPRICFFKYSCLKKTHTAEIRLNLFALYFPNCACMYLLENSLLCKYLLIGVLSLAATDYEHELAGPDNKKKYSIGLY